MPVGFLRVSAGRPDIHPPARFFRIAIIFPPFYSLVSTGCVFSTDFNKAPDSQMASRMRTQPRMEATFSKASQRPAS